MGGVRLPEMEAPTPTRFAELVMTTGQMRYGGIEIPFTQKLLSELYPTHAD